MPQTLPAADFLGGLHSGRNFIEHYTNLLVRFFQGAFNFHPTGEYHWEPGRNSEIYITGNAPVDRSVVGKVPILVVQFGTAQTIPVALGNLADYRRSTSQRTQLLLYSGYFMLYCVGTTDVEAMELANVCHTHLVAGHGRLSRPGGFHQIAQQPISFGQPSPPGALVPGDPDSARMIQLSIPAAYTYTIRSGPALEPAEFRSLDQILGYDRASEYPARGMPLADSLRLRVDEQDRAVRVVTPGQPDRTEIIEGARGLVTTRVIPRRRRRE